MERRCWQCGNYENDTCQCQALTCCFPGCGQPSSNYCGLWGDFVYCEQHNNYLLDELHKYDAENKN